MHLTELFRTARRPHFRAWLLLTTVLFGAVPPAAAETLSIYADDAYPPVVYAERGKPKGKLVDLLRRAEAITGDRYEIRLMPWKRAYESSLRGEAGLIGVSYTSERAALFDYSRPVHDDDIQLVVLKGREFAFSDLNDLRGKRLGGVIGASYGEVVDRAIASGVLSVDRDIGQVGRLRKLLAGRLDAALIGNGQIGFEELLNANDDLKLERGRLVVLPKPLVRDPLFLAFPKALNKTDALKRFNTALDTLAKDKRDSPAR